MGKSLKIKILISALFLPAILCTAFTISACNVIYPVKYNVTYMAGKGGYIEGSTEQRIKK